MYCLGTYYMYSNIILIDLVTPRTHKTYGRFLLQNNIILALINYNDKLNIPVYNVYINVLWYNK